MKKISITQIDDANDKLQPFTGLSLAFLQNYLDEDKAVIIKSIIISTIGSYSLTTPYVISGCIVSDSGKDVTNGEIFYNGKFYEVVGVNGTTNIAQFSVVKTQDPTADPITFSDSTSGNVHDIYKFVGTDTATAGTFNSSNFDYSLTLTGSKIYDNIYSAGAFTVNNAIGWDDFASMTYTTPNDGVTRKYIIEYKGYAETSNGVVDSSCQLRIYNSTDSAILDESKVGKSNFGAATEVVIVPVFMSTGVVSIAPNKTIIVQGGLSANQISFNKNRMSITEFK